MSTFQWIAVAVVTVMSSARITRLVTWDHFPPSLWIRDRWSKVTNGSKWELLTYCGYCFGLWASGFVLLWGYVSGWHWTWWLFNGWLGAGYLAAMVMAYDGDEG